MAASDSARAADSPANIAPISVSLLGAAGFIITADARVIAPLLPIIAHDFATTIGSVGLIVTAYTIPYALFQLVFGPLGDRLGKVRVMTWAMALFAVGTAACSVAPNLAVLNVLRLLTGTAAAAIVPLSLAYIGDAFAYRVRQAAIGQYLGAIGLGQILSTTLGGIVGNFISWRAIFLIFGALSVAIWLAFRRTDRRLGPQVNPDAPLGRAALVRYPRLLRDPAARIVIGLIFFEGAFFYGGFAYFGAFLRARFGLSYLVIGLLLSGFGLGSVLYSQTARWLIRGLRERGLVLLGGVVLLAGYAAMLLANVVWSFVLLTTMLGLGYYMLHSTFQTRATELAPGARGTAVSLFAFSFFLGQGAGAAAIGVVVDRYGYVPSFAICGIGCALVAALFLPSVWRFVGRAPVADTVPVATE